MEDKPETNATVQQETSLRKSENISRIVDLFQGPINIRSIALTGLFLYSSFLVLYVAKSIFLPFALALILSLLLAPLMRALKQFSIPEPLAAGVILIFFVSGLSYGLMQLANPATVWIERAPQVLRQVEHKFQSIKQSVWEVGRATRAIEKVTSLSKDKQTPEVEVKQVSLGGTLLNWTFDLFIGLIATLILLYFFLASGDLFLEKLVKVLPRFSDKRRAVEIVRQIEENISTYLLTITGINTGLGILVSMTMYLYEMPNPLLWGVMAGVLNYIPYVGSAIGLGVITLVATFTFNQINVIALVSVSYLLITGIEGNFLTPMLLKNRLTLNPVIVLVSVLFWGWLWGSPGALLAVPFVASMKIVCDQIEPLYPFGEFLGR